MNKIGVLQAPSGRNPPWIAIGLTVVVLAAVGLALHFKRGGAGPSAVVVNGDDLIKTDRANLTRKGVLDGETYGALIRLAQRGDPAAREAALSRMTDPSPLVRAGAAQALGYYDDEVAFAGAEALLSDPQVSVRLQAIQAMTHRPGPKRKIAVRNMLARPSVTVEERVAVASAMLALQPDADEKNQAVEQLLKLTAEKDAKIALGASVALVSSVPSDPRVTTALRGFLEKGSVPGIHDVAVRHLAAARDPWLRANFHKLESDPAPGVRIAVIQSMHLACPAVRWQVLEHALSLPGPSPVRQAAIQEIGTLGGPDAPVFLAKMVHTAKFSDPQEIAQARELLASLERDPKNSPDRCAGFPMTETQ